MSYFTQHCGGVYHDEEEHIYRGVTVHTEEAFIDTTHEEQFQEKNFFQQGVHGIVALEDDWEPEAPLQEEEEQEAPPQVVRSLQECLKGKKGKIKAYTPCFIEAIPETTTLAVKTSMKHSAVKPAVGNRTKKVATKKVAHLDAPYGEIQEIHRDGDTVCKETATMPVKHEHPRDDALPEKFHMRYKNTRVSREFGNLLRYRIFATPRNFVFKKKTVPQSQIVLVFNFVKELQCVVKLHLEDKYGMEFVEDTDVNKRYKKCAHFLMMYLKDTQYHVEYKSEGKMVTCNFEAFENDDNIPGFECDDCHVFREEESGCFVNPSSKVVICYRCAAKLARDQYGCMLGVLKTTKAQESIVGDSISFLTTRGQKDCYNTVHIRQLDVIYQLNGQIEHNLLKSWSQPPTTLP